MDQEMTAQTGEISLRDLLDLLNRRKKIFIQTLVVILAVGATITFMMKPLYRSGTRILVEGRALAMAQYSTGDPLSNLFMPDTGHDVPTQIEVLQGEKVLTDAYRTAGVPGDSTTVDVHQVNSTDVIEAVVESHTAAYAERLAKALPDTYRGYISGNRATEVTNALIFAQGKLKDEQNKLMQAELDLQRFKERQRVANVDTERSQAIADAAAAQADVKRTEIEIASQKARLNVLAAAQRAEPEIDEVPTTETNHQKDTLREQIATLRAKREALMPLYKAEAVEVQQVDNELAALEDHLKKMPEDVTTNTRSPNKEKRAYDPKIADVKAGLASLEAGLTRQLDRATRAQARLGLYSTLDRRQAELQREVEQHQGVVAQLSKSVLDLGLREKAAHDPVRVITSATVPELVSPKSGRNMLYAAIVGLVVGLCLALLQEFLDDRIHTQEEARRILGAPTLGYVPFVTREDTRLLSRSRGGPLLESYRVLRSNVQFATVDSPASSILITSSVPGEGKSMTAANLAVAMALDGRQVILVDADLRRPTQHEKFSLEAGPGLTDVLVGQAALDEALQETNIPGLYLLAAGPLPPNPAELLNSQAMRQLHAALKERAAAVVFDSPPCLATADAQVLSADVDGVIYIIQFGVARKSALRESGELLMHAHSRLMGVVFNKVETGDRRNAYYQDYSYSYATTTLRNGHTPRPLDGGSGKPAQSNPNSPRSLAIARHTDERTDGHHEEED